MIGRDIRSGRVTALARVQLDWKHQQGNQGGAGPAFTVHKQRPAMVGKIPKPRVVSQPPETIMFFMNVAQSSRIKFLLMHARCSHH